MVAYSRDGTLIATAEGSDGARVWDASTPGEQLTIPSPDSRESRYPGLERLNKIETPLAVLLEPDREPKARVFWTDFSADGRHLLTTHASGQVRVWDTKTWQVEQDFAVTSGEVRVARFSPDGSTILAGDTNGALYLWSLKARAVAKILTSPISEKNAVTGIEFSPDGGTLITSHVKASGPAVVIWGTAVWSAQERPGFLSAAFSPDGKWIAFGGSHLELANALSFEPVRQIQLPELTYADLIGKSSLASDPTLGARANEKVSIVIEALSFSPDGTLLAAGCVDGTVRLVNVPQ